MVIVNGNMLRTSFHEAKMNSRKMLLSIGLKYWLIIKLSQSDVEYVKPDANAGDK